MYVRICTAINNDRLWEGRYSPVWPDGKKHSRNVYAKPCEECEEKFKELILKMKAEIAQGREEVKAVAERPDQNLRDSKQKRRHPSKKEWRRCRQE